MEDGDIHNLRKETLHQQYEIELAWTISSHVWVPILLTITSNSSMGTHCCHPPKLLINAMMILSISGISIARHLMSWLGRLKLKSSINILSLFVAVLRHTTQPVSKGMRHSLNPRQNGTAAC
uniref:Uncharacterized protein n=1 Tax=Gossypium raimondii TaxID=29730 RepID=A0A0D2PUG8_GOSRA|nr:hypothetical protein B456_001G045400 [Gossypium raimondii]